MFCCLFVCWIDRIGKEGWNRIAVDIVKSFNVVILVMLLLLVLFILFVGNYIYPYKKKGELPPRGR